MANLENSESGVFQLRGYFRQIYLRGVFQNTPTTPY